MGWTLAFRGFVGADGERRGRIEPCGKYFNETER
jgi:hypothetical protein